jgi:hypothetical protein
MATAFFTEEELEELTCKKRHSSQRRVLNAMGISHIVRPDGSIAVMRAHVERLFGAQGMERKRKPTEPNWSAMNV